MYGFEFSYMKICWSLNGQSFSTGMVPGSCGSV